MKMNTYCSARELFAFAQKAGCRVAFDFSGERCRWISFGDCSSDHFFTEIDLEEGCGVVNLSHMSRFVEERQDLADKLRFAYEETSGGSVYYNIRFISSQGAVPINLVSEVFSVEEDQELAEYIKQNFPVGEEAEVA